MKRYRFDRMAHDQPYELEQEDSSELGDMVLLSDVEPLQTLLTAALAVIDNIDGAEHDRLWSELDRLRRGFKE